MSFGCWVAICLLLGIGCQVLGVTKVKSLPQFTCEHKVEGLLILFGGLVVLRHYLLGLGRIGVA